MSRESGIIGDIIDTRKQYWYILYGFLQPTKRHKLNDNNKKNCNKHLI